jgi:hypothetical protein
MTKLTKKSGDGTPEDSVPTYPTPADKVGGGRPPKEPAEVTQRRAAEREADEALKPDGGTGFAHDHGAGRDPQRSPGGKVERALGDMQRAADATPSPHASEDKGDQASGSLDAEGEGDRGAHRGGGEG